jgi:hypothetical protein
MFGEFCLNSQRPIIELSIELAILFTLTRAFIKFIENLIMSQNHEEERALERIAKLEQEIELKSKFLMFALQKMIGEHLNIINYKFSEEERSYVDSKIRENQKESYTLTESQCDENMKNLFSDIMQWINEREARRETNQQ